MCASSMFGMCERREGPFSHSMLGLVSEGSKKLAHLRGDDVLGSIKFTGRHEDEERRPRARRSREGRARQCRRHRLEALHHKQRLPFQTPQHNLSIPPTVQRTESSAVRRVETGQTIVQDGTDE
jgi:hypothetical protein